MEPGVRSWELQAPSSGKWFRPAAETDRPAAGAPRAAPPQWGGGTSAQGKRSAAQGRQAIHTISKHLPTHQTWLNPIEIPRRNRPNPNRRHSRRVQMVARSTARSMGRGDGAWGQVLEPGGSKRGGGFGGRTEPTDHRTLAPCGPPQRHVTAGKSPASINNPMNNLRIANPHLLAMR